MGRLADRFGIAVPLAIGTLALGGRLSGDGNVVEPVAGRARTRLLIGLGCSATFGPLMADISHWFMRRRGIAVAIAASGNYFAGTIWPPVVQHFIAADGWRATHIGIGLFCLVAMLPLVLLLRRRLEDHHTDAAGAAAARRQAEAPFSPRTLQVLLCIAGVACCVAMSMPQVHIVAYCGDLGYGVARGAEMLSLMLGFGIVSRIALGLHRRPHRRRAHAAARLGAARHRAVALSLVRRAVLALRDLGAVRPVPGRHRAELRHHRARIFSRRAKPARASAWS